MAARFFALVPRLLALAVIWLLGTSTFTFAADNSGRPPASAPAAGKPKPTFVRVPDVRGQPYVFAKGMLQDAGFAWRIEGSVRGYAANTVSSQRPAPGTKVLDNGAPTIVLTLAANKDYGERGVPEDSSSYAGTRVVLASEVNRRKAPRKAAEVAEEAEKVAEQPAPPTEKPRKPDFVVPGAPPEPADEMPLPDRARRLAARLAGKPEPTKKLVSYWLYQHAWIVTGALFGWSEGEQALRILIRVDRDLQERWGVGARSERNARRALAEVQSKKEQ